MNFNDSLASVTSDVKEAIKIIGDNMIKTRPRGDIVYRPYRKCDVSYDRGLLEPHVVNLKKLYPNAKKGNVVYVGTIFDSVADYDASICMIGNVKVFYEGKEIFDYEKNPTDKKRSKCPIHFRKGRNPVLFMVRCDEDDEFKFEFMPSVPAFWFWALDYILHVRITSPIECFSGEDGVGISDLYVDEQPFDGNYVYPAIGKEKNEINFSKIFGAADGTCAYAYTEALNDTNLKLKAFSKSKVLVNGEVALSDEIELKQGDKVLVKSLKEDMWGFSFSDDAKIGIPFLESSRYTGDKWLTLGTFGQENCIDIPYAPELKMQFTNAYVTEGWNKTFWKLSSENDYIRPYMDTCFYAQWFYALMVGQFGLLQAAKVLNNSEYIKYFSDGMQNMAEFYNYMLYERENFGQPTFIQRGMDLSDLDAIGTMGMNLCELYKLTSSPEALYCIEVLATAAKDNIPRFSDGTYCRPKDMWADDTFMSCPFLVRLGLIKKDRYYFEEAVRQIMGFKKRLWLEDERLFSHIFLLDNNIPNRITWGRGNGWVFVAISDILENIPKDIVGREELLNLFKDFADGIVKKQDNEGLWHQVITRPDSYQETSCTGMFLLGLCRGVKNGWLGKEYEENIKRAFFGLLKNKIDKKGNIYDVCRGSGNSMDENYYMNLAVIDNDDHGTGIILMALSEMAKIFSDY
ncbi:MAG: glycoside hydrolase family 88 protein [Clostridia bacterium]|nr:glycoside hydrolase family 88 protein [Clostridia bacterium]